MGLHVHNMVSPLKPIHNSFRGVRVLEYNVCTSTYTKYVHIPNSQKHTISLASYPGFRVCGKPGYEATISLYIVAIYTYSVDVLFIHEGP